MSRDQDLSQFRMPLGFRGRSAVTVQAWWIVQGTLFRWSPQFAYGFRRMLLRAFGARVGAAVKVRPSATVTYPWKVTIGDRAWIGDDAVLYSLGEIVIGSDTVVSQRAYLCAGDHDHRDPAFPIRARPITLGDEVWVATDVYVGPDVTIGSGAVVGARSSVFRNLPARMVCVGSPCVPRGPRRSGDAAGGPA
jgi:putative colanic acid biosynthesis acetyltransferase WcaF